jgi:hypothetical protein
MKARTYTLIVIVAAALLALSLATGCQRARSDAQIAADVQSKINGDPAVQSRQFTVQAGNGVVTLSGTVASDAERSAAASDAAQVEGVKTVVNNLQVAPPVTASVQPPPPEPQAQPEPPRRSEPVPHPVRRSKPSGFKPPMQATNAVTDYSSPARDTYRASNAPLSSENTAPLPPPKPVEVTVPEGTSLTIRLIDPIDSEKNQPGDHFRATLDSPVVVGDKIALPAGADVYGRVTNVKSAAHFAGRSELALELTRISANGKSYEIHTDQFSKQGAARGKNTAAKVGGGAALGAIIGGLAGGGKGAAIGGAIGAGAGGTAQAVTKGQQIKLTSEQILAFHLESPLTVTPSSKVERNAGRQRLNVND